MTVFQAYKPASLTVSRFRALDLLTALPTGTGPSPLVSTEAEYKIEGSGHLTQLDFVSVSSVSLSYFSPDLGCGPIAGEVASLDVDTDTGGGLSTAYTFSGMSVGFVSAFEDDVANNRLDDLIHLIFSGGDVIVGSRFADYLAGFGGNDRITGGAGNDRLSGGSGRDTFVSDGGLATT